MSLPTSTTNIRTPMLHQSRTNSILQRNKSVVQMDSFLFASYHEESAAPKAEIELQILPNSIDRKQILSNVEIRERFFEPYNLTKKEMDFMMTRVVSYAFIKQIEKTEELIKYIKKQIERANWLKSTDRPTIEGLNNPYVLKALENRQITFEKALELTYDEIDKLERGDGKWPVPQSKPTVPNMLAPFII